VSTDHTTYLSRLSELEDCALCPRNCHANRFSSELGYCKSDASFNISSICIHKGEEPPISGRDGICNIFFTHCNLQCIYCQNYQISDITTGTQETRMALDEVICRITRILDKGIRRVGFVSPSHFIPQVKIIIDCIESLGYNPVWVYNTNGYDKVEALQTLEPLVDVYLPDFKYSDPGLARSYSDAPAYPETAKKVLKEMFQQKGSALITNEQGMAESGIIIRHLVLPGEVQNSLGVLDFIEELSPKLHISLMSQYFPTPKVSCHPKLGTTVSRAEYDDVIERMERLGLSNGWIQELSSTSSFRPDFNKEDPFEI